MRLSGWLYGFCVALGAVCFKAQGQLIRPNTAVANSVFSATYQAENAINGSGLPANFGPGDAHAAYSSSGGGNHWTTATGTAPTDASIRFGFTTPQDLGVFYLWNHQSNGGIAANPGYDVTLFDLTFLGADGTTVLRTLNDLVAQPDVATGQTFTFPVVEDVSFVRFDVEAVQSSPTFTGLAEVAFAVPEPGLGMIVGVGVLALCARRRRDLLKKSPCAGLVRR